MRLLLSLLLVAVTVPAVVTGCFMEEPVAGETEMKDSLENTGKTEEIKIPLIDTMVPEVTETATFALGWFWGPDSRFGSIDGVVRTRVGYSGGTKDNPSYYDLGDHSETIEIDYDPAKISYEQLLDVFWQSHNPEVFSYSTQYRSAIFYHNDEQKRLAGESMKREAERRGADLYTAIEPFSGFYLAEDYHQKYCLTQEFSILREMQKIYPDLADFVNSTAVTRLNAYVCGYGSAEEFENNIDKLGLSEESKAKLLDIADNRGLTPGCPVPESAEAQ